MTCQPRRKALLSQAYDLSTYVNCLFFNVFVHDPGAESRRRARTNREASEMHTGMWQRSDMATPAPSAAGNHTTHAKRA